MEKFNAFLELRHFDQYLAGEHQSAFNEIFGFISLFAALIIALWSLRWLPPFRNIVSSIRNDLYSEFSESDLIQELIPNFQHRCYYYKILVRGLLVAMLGCYLMSFCYGSYAIAALFGEHVKINKFTAFFILSSLSIFMFLVGYYFMKEANKLAVFLRRVIF